MRKHPRRPQTCWRKASAEKSDKGGPQPSQQSAIDWITRRGLIDNESRSRKKNFGS